MDSIKKNRLKETKINKKLILLSILVLFSVVILLFVFSYLQYRFDKPLLRIAIYRPTGEYNLDDPEAYEESRRWAPSLPPYEEYVSEIHKELLEEDIHYLFTGKTLYFEREMRLLELKENGNLYWIKGLRFAVDQDDITAPVLICIPSEVHRIRLNKQQYNEAIEFIRQVFPSHGIYGSERTSNGERALWWKEYPSIVLKEDSIVENNSSGIGRIFDFLFSFIPE